MSLFTYQKNGLFANKEHILLAHKNLKPSLDVLIDIAKNKRVPGEISQLDQQHQVFDFSTQDILSPYYKAAELKDEDVEALKSLADALDQLDQYKNKNPKIIQTHQSPNYGSVVWHGQSSFAQSLASVTFTQEKTVSVPGLSAPLDIENLFFHIPANVLWENIKTSHAAHIQHHFWHPIIEKIKSQLWVDAISHRHYMPREIFNFNLFECLLKQIGKDQSSNHVARLDEIKKIFSKYPNGDELHRFLEENKDSHQYLNFASVLAQFMASGVIPPAAFNNSIVHEAQSMTKKIDTEQEMSKQIHADVQLFLTKHAPAVQEIILSWAKNLSRLFISDGVNDNYKAHRDLKDVCSHLNGFTNHKNLNHILECLDVSKKTLFKLDVRISEKDKNTLEQEQVWDFLALHDIPSRWGSRRPKSEKEGAYTYSLATLPLNLFENLMMGYMACQGVWKKLGLSSKMYDGEIKHCKKVINFLQDLKSGVINEESLDVENDYASSKSYAVFSKKINGYVSKKDKFSGIAGALLFETPKIAEQHVARNSNLKSLDCVIVPCSVAVLPDRVDSTLNKDGLGETMEAALAYQEKKALEKMLEEMGIEKIKEKLAEYEAKINEENPGQSTDTSTFNTAAPRKRKL